MATIRCPQAASWSSASWPAGTTAQGPARTPAPDPRLDRALRHLLLLGAVLVLAVPAARGHNAWIGALPLWLLGMPLASWWALHRFRLPRRAAVPVIGLPRRRGRRSQARRRAVPARRAAAGLRVA